MVPSVYWKEASAHPESIPGQKKKSTVSIKNEKERRVQTNNNWEFTMSISQPKEILKEVLQVGSNPKQNN